MNINDLLGAMMQSGMTRSADQRMRNSLGGRTGLESLAGMFGGAAGGRSSGLPFGSGAGGALGGLLGSVLGEAGHAVGGKQNLALGGLGSLAGALLGGGGRRSVGGAMSGGAMALLAALALQGLKAMGDQKQGVPLGLREPQTEAEKKELEQHSELILKAMINAAKADGAIDKGEIQRILGKLKETGVDDEALQFVMAEMQKPIETEKLIAAAQGHPELAAKMYGASLLAIEVDTTAEKTYLEQLAAGLGLKPEVTQRMREAVGLQSA